MEGVAEVRSVCTVGPDSSVGKWVVVATFRTGGCCRYARLFAELLDADTQIWFVERDGTGKVFSERLLEEIAVDHNARNEHRRRVAEAEAVVASAQEELRQLKRIKF